MGLFSSDEWMFEEAFYLGEIERLKKENNQLRIEIESLMSELCNLREYYETQA